MGNRYNVRSLTNERFGNLLVLGPANDGKWRVKCDCGNTKEVLRNSLISGNTKSCGCLRIQAAATAREHALQRNKSLQISKDFIAQYSNQFRKLLKALHGHGYTFSNDYTTAHDPVTDAPTAYPNTVAALLETATKVINDTKTHA